MKIDCFIMNPPYNSGKGGIPRAGENGAREGRLGTNIMKKLENHRVVCISNYAVFSSVLTKITHIEKEQFPGVGVFVFIWTMNDNKQVLFPTIHKLKTVKKSDYFFLKLSNANIYQIIKTNNSIKNRKYIDVKNDEEMKEINNYIKEHWEPYKVFVPSVTVRNWIIANILYNSPWIDRFVK